MSLDDLDIRGTVKDVARRLMSAMHEAADRDVPCGIVKQIGYAHNKRNGQTVVAIVLTGMETMSDDEFTRRLMQLVRALPPGEVIEGEVVDVAPRALPPTSKLLKG